MAVQVRRSLRGTVAALMNLVLIAAAGVVILGNEFTQGGTPSTLWIVVGGMLLFWAALILSGVLRPLTAETDETGISVRKLMGQHRFGWNELLWADFEKNPRFAVIAAKVDGREKFAAISKRGVEAEDYARLVGEVEARRPGLPKSRAEVSAS